MKRKQCWSGASWGIGAGLVLYALFAAGPAEAAWSQIKPGVDYQQYTKSGPTNRITAARVNLCYPGLELRATKSGERRQTPSAFGQAVGADLVINADFFSFDTYNVSGLAIGDGEPWPGTSDPSAREAIAFGNGRVEISKKGNSITDFGWINEAVGGWFTVLDENEVQSFTSAHCTARHPRTIVGLSKDKRTLYMVIVDGRSTSSAGMTCPEQGQLMKDLGAWDAISLDGGGSSAMWIRGQGVANYPSGGSQRVVANHLGIIAKGDGAPEACNNINGAFELNTKGAADFYTQGSSDGIKDLLVGDEFEVDILLENTSSTIFRGVEFDYRFDKNALKPLDYKIYSDYPEEDRSTWELNDADEDPDNPGRGDLGDSGKFLMNAFSPNETKRVNIKLRADRYSMGSPGHADIRAWVRHIDSMYGEQKGWDEEPTNQNLLGGLLQAMAEVDVLSPYEWQFNGGKDELEGWTGCDGSDEGLGVDADLGAMIPAGDAPASCAKSPEWTQVDADTYDQMVIRLSAASAHPLTVGWKSADQEFEDARSVTFMPQPGEETYVVDLKQSGEWAGEVDGLTLDWSGADELAVDAIFFQSSADQKTSSADESFVEAPPVDLVDDEEPGADDAGGHTGAPDSGSSPRPDAGGADAGGDGQAPGPGDGENGGELNDPEYSVDMSGGCGCSSLDQNPLGGVIPAAFALVGVLGLGLRRRSRR